MKNLPKKLSLKLVKHQPRQKIKLTPKNNDKNTLHILIT